MSQIPTDSPPRFMAVTLSSPRLCTHVVASDEEYGPLSFCRRVTTVGIVPALTPLAAPAPRCFDCMPAELKEVAA